MKITFRLTSHFLAWAILPAALASFLSAQSAQTLDLQLDPAHSNSNITLVGNMHTVEGSFQAKRGEVHYDVATSKASGEIVFDATSGKTGNDSRDKKMHRDVIESAKFSEIAFRPDYAQGQLSPQGDSTLQVHGQFSIHGAEHEITIPVVVHLEGSTWTATADFTVPYVNWGMKNPSVLFLRVGNDVKVRFHAAGTVQR